MTEPFDDATRKQEKQIKLTEIKLGDREGQPALIPTVVSAEEATPEEEMVPAVVSEENATSEPEIVPAGMSEDDPTAEQERSDTMVDSAANAEVGERRRNLVMLPPAKKRRLPFELILWFVPLFVILACIAAHPGALPYLQAELLDTDKAVKIKDFTLAYQANHELPILAERASMYGRIGNHEAQLQDYKVLLAKTGKLPFEQAYLQVAAASINDQGVNPTALDLMHRAMQKSKLFGLIPVRLNAFATQYALLACDQSEQYQPLATIDPEKSEMRNDDAYQLKALAQRELGDYSGCMQSLSNINLTYCIDLPEGSQVVCFKALTELDQSKTREAAEEISAYDRMVKNIDDVQANQWLLALTRAWTCYGLGQYDQALKYSDLFQREFKGDHPDIPELQAAAANDLLRYKILQQLNQTSKADSALISYKKRGCSGKLFIPKCYRSWLSAAPAVR